MTDIELQDRRLARRQLRQKIAKTILISAVISSVVFAFACWWQGTATAATIENALWFTFALELTVAWSLFVYNENIFSPLLHGTKTFFLMLIGKRPKEDYYTYYRKVEEHPVPKYFIIAAFISTLVILILAIVWMNYVLILGA